MAAVVGFIVGAGLLLAYSVWRTHQEYAQRARRREQQRFEAPAQAGTEEAVQRRAGEPQ